jgi:hypothetical protein
VVSGELGVGAEEAATSHRFLWLFAAKRYGVSLATELGLQTPIGLRKTYKGLRGGFVGRRPYSVFIEALFRQAGL